MVDIELIRELVQLMSEHDLAEIRLRDGAEHIALRRGLPESAAMPAQMMVPAPMYASADNSAATSDHRPLSPPAPLVDENAGLVAITSPMVGTFYAASNPQSPPFVNVGSTVNTSSVVCIIEAMKVFNEIKSETTGVVAKVLVTNGAAVEYGQPLFMVKPNV